ncbi:immunity protein Imm33 domain-containing protein [Galactobacter caseinivorans]|uniref:immunity protein Imm33 domain-containing protein n=1 Tax=Galactobacter caseinivorans TaxID=2676123 RepID=UPI001314C9E7|nr:DUF2185 domain-containing protein [Galactobacter caseinivorans]
MSEPTFIDNAGSCIATAQAIAGPGRIRWMLRTPSAVSSDSGWRFYADEDNEENVAHTTNMRVLGFNQVAQLDPIVAEVYHEPVGSDFELVTLPDGARQLRDSTTGRVLAGPGSEPTSPEPMGVGASAEEAAEVPAAAASDPADAAEPAKEAAPTAQAEQVAPAAPAAPAEQAAPAAPAAPAAQAAHVAPAAPLAPSAPVAPVAPEPAQAAPVASSAAAAPSVPSAAAAPHQEETSTPAPAQDDARARAEQDALVAASAPWLRPAVQGWMGANGPQTRTALLSELFGSHVLVPLSADGQTLSGFAHNGATIIPLHTSREGAMAWQQRLNVPVPPSFTAITGDEALRRAFEQQGAASVVVDPVEAGVEIRSNDEFLAGFTRNGTLKRLVRDGDRAAIMRYLTSPGAYGVYLYRAVQGQPHFPLLVTRQSGGEREFALFSSALEVFRYQGDGSASEVSVDWVRQNLAPDMYLCIDPGADGGFIEFSPAELASYGFRRA